MDNVQEGDQVVVLGLSASIRNRVAILRKALPAVWARCSGNTKIENSMKRVFAEHEKSIPRFPGPLVSSLRQRARSCNMYHKIAAGGTIPLSEIHLFPVPVRDGYETVIARTLEKAGGSVSRHYVLAPRGSAPPGRPVVLQQPPVLRNDHYTT